MISPPWTRPRPRVLRPRSSRSAPFEPRALLLRPLPSSLALSLALATRTRSSATVRRHPPPIPWPPLRSCPIQCHGELRLTVSCSGHPLVCPLPPCCVRSTLTGVFSCVARVRHRRPVEPLCLRRCFVTPALLLEVSNLLVPLIWLSPLCSSRDCSPKQSSVVVSLPRRGLRSLMPPRRCEVHGRVRQTALITPRLVPKPREPRRGGLLVSGELSPWDRAAPPRPSQPWPLDFGRLSEIGWFGLNPSRSNPSPSIEI
jgi:hypothetical protein